jgi:hypothetical protein
MPKKKAFRRIGKLGPKGQRAVVVVRTRHSDTLFPEKLAKANALLKELGEIKF